MLVRATHGISLMSAPVAGAGGCGGMDLLQDVSVDLHGSYG